MQSLSSAPGAKTQSKTTIHDFRDTYVKLIAKATRVRPKEQDPTVISNNDNDDNLVESKTFPNTKNLNTSSFTVCARVRPFLSLDTSQQSDEFVATVAIENQNNKVKPNITVCTPKINFRGQPKLETKSFDFDHVFGSESTNEELAELTVAPLIKRALDGQVGVIFAYGQTGSGKTHSMNGVMDHLLQSTLLFDDDNDGTNGISISFSYIEILGDYVNDCLGPNDSLHSSNEIVSIGEMMDGRLVVRNISSHIVYSSEELSHLVEQAKSLRSTAATEKNATSSRSHGIGIITCKDVKTGIEGSLYIIDLAGSERAADSKGHDKARIAETKAINSSLSTLKDCIRARTMASQPGMGGSVHVPYRRSKLTLLMKDVFDAGCTRLCSTVVLATCSPLASDCAHSANTLKYSSPLCDIPTKGEKAIKMQVDKDDPALWSNEQLLKWVTRSYPSITDPSIFVGVLSGVQLCALPEKEYYSRMENVSTDHSFFEECKDINGDTISDRGIQSVDLAKHLYLSIWTLMSDAKTRKRRKDGSIITKEDEENERLRIQVDAEEHARLWAEKEKHLLA